MITICMARLFLQEKRPGIPLGLEAYTDADMKHMHDISPQQYNNTNLPFSFLMAAGLSFLEAWLKLFYFFCQYSFLLLLLLG